MDKNKSKNLKSRPTAKTCRIRANLEKVKAESLSLARMIQSFKSQPRGLWKSKRETALAYARFRKELAVLRNSLPVKCRALIEMRKRLAPHRSRRLERRALDRLQAAAQPLG